MEPKNITELMEQMRKEPLQFVSIKDDPDFQTMALLAAQTLPNQSVSELLINAEKIERWLIEPGRVWRSIEEQVKQIEA